VDCGPLAGRVEWASRQSPQAAIQTW
jgi:hypothetical protein